MLAYQHINKILNNRNVNSIGIDKSQSMINFCNNTNNNTNNNSNNTNITYDFTNIDINNINSLDSLNLEYNKPISHILCLNMELYYIKNHEHFFSKCYNTLDNNGYLILHIVDHDKFNNINDLRNI